MGDEGQGGMVRGRFRVEELVSSAPVGCSWPAISPSKPKPRWGEVAPYYHSVQPDLGDRGYMKEFNNWILAQFPSGGGEPVMLALASVAAQVPALGVAQGWCPC